MVDKIYLCLFGGLILLLVAVVVYGLSLRTQDYNTHTQKTVNTSNSNIELDLLFEKDSCKIYRFHDLGYYHYFTTCKNSQVESPICHSAGKVTVCRTETIETKAGK